MATMTDAAKIVLLFCACVASSKADKVPVLMWSQSRPMTDLPQVYAGNTVDSDTFLHKYLSPVASKAGQNVVAFIQDKLHVDDFTKYADVYNPFSDGGAFKNIKGLMDEHFSVHLPSVESPKSVIDSLMKEFQGHVHKVTSPEHVSGLKLEEHKSYLIIVHLPSASKNEEEAIAENDEKVGDYVKALDKEGIKYTAVFTGKRDKRSTNEAFQGRHLLEVDEDSDTNVTGIFAKVDGKMFFFSRHITIKVFQDNDQNKQLIADIAFPTDHNNYTSASKWDNDTAVLALEAPVAISNMSDVATKFMVAFQFIAELQGDRWKAVNFTLTVRNLTDNLNVTVVTNQGMNLKDSEMVVPPMFSYHCSDLILNPFSKENGTYATITFDGIQFQPYGLKGNRFSEAWDCVGFFTTPIWMGLFPVGIFTLILIIGMYMVTQLSTMDQFDDPKGKTITVNVNE